MVWLCAEAGAAGLFSALQKRLERDWQPVEVELKPVMMSRFGLWVCWWVKLRRVGQARWPRVEVKKGEGWKGLGPKLQGKREVESAERGAWAGGRRWVFLVSRVAGRFWPGDGVAAWGAGPGWRQMARDSGQREEAGPRGL